MEFIKLKRLQNINTKSDMCLRDRAVLFDVAFQVIPNTHAEFIRDYVQIGTKGHLRTLLLIDVNLRYPRTHNTYGTSASHR